VFVAYLIVTVITIVANAAAAAADLARAGFVLGNSAEVGVPPSWLPLLATLKAAGAAGLLIGMSGVVLDIAVLRYLGIAAAIGLILFFTGALIAHLRARVFYNLYFPGTFWLLAIASLTLAAAQ
jgi:hypothetical protein